MPDSPLDEQEAFANALAEVQQEFQQGLTDRLSLMESAFAKLEEGFDTDAAQKIFHQAHSLKGTAGAFGADTLVGPAREISAIARGWVDRTDTTESELSDVRRELGRLRQAVTDYQSTGA